jgi:hypothetical protein
MAMLLKTKPKTTMAETERRRPSLLAMPAYP